MIWLFVGVGALGLLVMFVAVTQAGISLLRLPPDSRGRSIWWLYGLESDVTADDLLLDEDARRTWLALSDDERTALVEWCNKPATTRSRVKRQRDATRALKLGGAKSGLAQPSVLETILTSLPWRAP